MNTIKKGSRGEDVKTLQKALNLLADGIFGVLTEEAVIAFQKEHKLTPDGIVGPKTWEKILSIPAVKPQGTVGNLKKSRRSIDKLIVHCTATEEGKDYTVAQIRSVHKAKGWSDIGYHYLIRPDGKIEVGRDVDIIGAHCTGHNSHSIGISYVGGCPLGNLKGAKDTRTPEQKASLIKLLTELKKLYPKATIHGHREFANKACPCFDAKTEYAKI